MHRGKYRLVRDGGLEGVGLGLKLWKGEYEGKESTWLRWCDRDGQLIPTGAERVKQERKRAEQERERAEQEAAARREAEARAQTADAQAQAEAEARRAAEEELARLKAELARLRSADQPSLG